MERISDVIARLITKAKPVTEVEMAARRKVLLDEAWKVDCDKIGVPFYLREASLEGPTPPGQSGMEHVRSYMRDGFLKGRCVWILGNTGCGKSYAAAGALRAAPNVSRRWFDMEVLCQDLMSQESEEVFRSARKTYFVVLDDFGSHWTKDSGAVESRLESIFRIREANRLPTIVTSNLSKPEIAARVSGRTRSRIEGAWGSGINLFGPDLRKR